MQLGLYVSRCSGAVDRVVDIDGAMRGAMQSAEVAAVIEDLFDPSSIDRIVSDVERHELDAVVIAGDSPDRLAKSLSAGHLVERIVGAGINPNRVVIVNLLEQVALAHPDDPAGATAKAAALIEAGIAQALLAEPLEEIPCRPLHSVLVLGVTTESGVAAQRLLQLGFDVTLADRSAGSAIALGAADARATWSYVVSHTNARFIDFASLADGEGWLGDFEITLATPSGPVGLQAGGILLALPEDAEWIAELRQHFRVDIDDDGHARSIDPGMHPAETVDPGIMVVPVRREGAQRRDLVAAADAAAMALLLRLQQPVVHHYRDTSAVDTTLCGGCASCVRTCAFGACFIGEDGVSHVDVRRCRGCGKCVVSCPVGARDIVTSPHDALLAAVRGLARADVGPTRMIGFLCGGCGYPAADNASATVAKRGSGYTSALLPVRIPCGGRLDTLYVLEAFRVGFDAVCVFRCREGHCHNLVGNLDMDRRINLLRAVLRSRGIDDARLRIVDISPFEGDRFVETVEELWRQIAPEPSAPPVPALTTEPAVAEHEGAIA